MAEAEFRARFRFSYGKMRTFEGCRTWELRLQEGSTARTSEICRQLHCKCIYVHSDFPEAMLQVGALGAHQSGIQGQNHLPWPATVLLMQPRTHIWPQGAGECRLSWGLQADSGFNSKTERTSSWQKWQMSQSTGAQSIHLHSQWCPGSVLVTQTRLSLELINAPAHA